MCVTRFSKVFELRHKEESGSNMICLSLSWKWKHGPVITAVAKKMVMFILGFEYHGCLVWLWETHFSFACLTLIKLVPVVSSLEEEGYSVCAKCWEKWIQIIRWGFLHRSGQIFLLKGKLKTLHLKLHWFLILPLLSNNCLLVFYVCVFVFKVFCKRFGKTHKNMQSFIT